MTAFRRLDGDPAAPARRSVRANHLSAQGNQRAISDDHVHKSLTTVVSSDG